MDKDSAGRFVKGCTPGPGRPKGSGYPSFAKLIGDDAIRDLAQRIATGAKEGDATCMKIAADRLWPALTRSELSGIDGEAIAVEAPDWKSWSTEELAELKATAARIAEQRKARAAATNGHSEPATQH